VREKKIESALVKRTINRGGLCYKFTSPARRNVPDRLCLFPVPPIHRDIVKKYILFIECKAPGELPNAGQLREIVKLQNLGFNVEVVDSL
jgi:hypothetical protein